MFRPGMLTIGEKDKKGRPVLWFRPEMLKKAEGGQQRLRNKQITEKLDKQYPNEGWILAGDSSQMTRENVDMDYYLFCLKIHMVYYPRSAKFIIPMYIPSAIDDVSKTLMDVIGDYELKNRVKFMKFKELTDNYVDAKNVPSYVTRT